MHKTRIIGIIPARYTSKRFEGKALASICGKPMIQHVYENSRKSKVLNDVIIATDDARIRKVVDGFGGKVVMTSKKHESGTDRVAEVAKKLDAEIIINIQGDEPLIRPEMINEAVKPLIADSTLKMSSLMSKIHDLEELDDPNVVKVVTDRNDFALYFSRSLIPYPKVKRGYRVYKHLGVYVYRKDFLLEFTKMNQTPLEKTEGLEQLRALENGYRIKMVKTNRITISVDTPSDLLRVEEVMKNKIK